MVSSQVNVSGQDEESDTETVVEGTGKTVELKIIYNLRSNYSYIPQIVTPQIVAFVKFLENASVSDF